MSSVNKKEIEKFSKMAAEWWDPSGKFKPLHKFNPIRIKYIKENIINSFKLKSKQKPLDKINILDIGCGGGLLSEPMTRLGANVTGIDASSKNISIAKLHAKKSKLKIETEKKIKTLMIAAIALVGFQTVNAQAKTAHVDVNELMSKMPAVLDAQNQLKKLSDTYTAEYKTMVEEYQGKLKKYDAEASTVTDAVNQTRQQEVQDMAKRISDYQETAQKDLQKKDKKQTKS